MHIYYVAGLPYSDELYHHGIKGMKWYQRRYQNEDGSLTSLGKIHYGIGNAAKKTGQAVGRAAKKIKDRRVQKFKDKHKWMMSDEELQKRIERVSAEKKYKDLLKDTGPQKRGRKLIGEILSEGAKTLGRGAFNKFTNDLFNGPDKDSLSYIVSENVKERFKDAWDNDKMYDKKKLGEAVEYVELLRRLEGKGGGQGGGQGGGKKGKGKGGGQGGG